MATMACNQGYYPNTDLSCPMWQAYDVGASEDHSFIPYVDRPWFSAIFQGGPFVIDVLILRTVDYHVLESTFVRGIHP
jgi:hypothetical protein